MIPARPCRPQDYPPHDPPGRRGQALVEFALVAPLMLLMIIAFAEVSSLVAAEHAWQREADALADWSADHPDDPIPAGLLADCDPVWVTIGDVVSVDATCRYRTRTGLLDGIPVSVSAVAAAEPSGAVLGASATPSVAP